jgi:hypothetical protein
MSQRVKTSARGLVLPRSSSPENGHLRKKCPSPSTGKRNAQRLNQWKAKRNEAVVATKVNAEAQTENRNTQRDETTQTDQQNSHDQVHHKPHRVI